MKEYCSYVDGKYLLPAEREVLKRSGTAEPHAVVSRASADDISYAADVTVRSFKTSRRMTVEERKSVLSDVSQKVLKASEEFVELLVSSIGKPITMARQEVRHCAEALRLAAIESERMGGSVLPMDSGVLAEPGRMGILRRFPRGPVLAFAPFNFPLSLAAHKAAPAFAVGNSVLLKPATVAAAPTLRLAELFVEAGCPKGIFNVLLARSNQIDSLLFDERFTMIAFTGDSKRGWGIKAKSGRKKVALKLGGDSAAIVHSDADLDHVMDRCLMGGFAYAGQVCVSLQRLYVHRPLMVSFAERFAERVSELKEGDPRDENAVIVPLINENSAKRVEAWVHEAVAKGARILCGGARKGAFYPATVLTDVDPDCEIYRSQVFGPVVILEGYDTFQEAVEKVNSSRYGLQAGVFTRDMERILYAYEQSQVGAVIVNDVPTFRDDAMPFGGVKESGLGREGIRYAMEEMTEPRLLVMNRSPLED